MSKEKETFWKLAEVDSSIVHLINSFKLNYRTLK